MHNVQSYGNRDSEGETGFVKGFKGILGQELALSFELLRSDRKESFLSRD